MRGRSLLVAVLVLLAPMAEAVEVYFNGVKVTGGILNQKFDKVDLRFDEQGDVHITAPGSDFQGAAPAAPPAAAAPAAPATPPPPAAPATKFWLVLDATTPGQYRVSVKANGQPVAEIPEGSRQWVADLTGKLAPGANAIEITFLPVIGAPMVAPGADAITIMVGEGTQAADGTLTIKRVMGTVKQPTGRKGAEARSLNFSL